MVVDYIPPTHQAKAFHCPQCKAYSHQTWYQLGFHSKDPERTSMVAGSTLKEQTEDPRGFFTGSRCTLCGNVTVWYKGSIIFPATSIAPQPSSDMPQDVADDFNEAREVLAKSPRSAAALLRLATQKLCKHLGQPGKNINDDIKALVKAGLPLRIQKALDTVRVIGNNAVHPGEIDLRDDQETALALFGLVNFIVADRITHPREMDELYSRLPESSLAQIARRDQTP